MRSREGAKGVYLAGRELVAFMKESKLQREESVGRGLPKPECFVVKSVSPNENLVFGGDEEIVPGQRSKV
jgi:hypothetical protein